MLVTSSIMRGNILLHDNVHFKTSGSGKIHIFQHYYLALATRYEAWLGDISILKRNFCWLTKISKTYPTNSTNLQNLLYNSQMIHYVSKYNSLKNPSVYYSYHTSVYNSIKIHVIPLVYSLYRNTHLIYIIIYIHIYIFM